MRYSITFSHSTILKRSPSQANSLPDSDKVNCKPGDSFRAESVKDAGSNHALLELAEPLSGHKEWYAFVPHINVKSEDKLHSPIPGAAHHGKLIPPSEWRMNSIAKGICHHFEGCLLDAYLCPVGIPTIGWGNTFYEDRSPVRMGDRISQARADSLSQGILRQLVADLSLLVDTPLRGSAIGAITSFAYNIGVGEFQRSTFLKYLNAGYSVEELQFQLKRWCKGDGVELPGLVARRNCEAVALGGGDWREVR